MKKYITGLIAVLIVVSLGILIPSCGKDEDEEYIIRDNVELPEDNTELLEVQVNGDSLTFIYKAGSTVPFYDPGDILVGEKAGGYLKEVQSTVISGDTLHVLSEQAALTDAIEIGSIDTIIALQLQGQLMSPIIFDTIIQGKSGKSYRCYLTGGQPQLIPMGELFEIRIPDITIDIMSGSNVALRVHVDTLVLTKSIDIDLNLIIDGGAIEVFRLVADATDEVRFAGTTMDVYQTISDDIELLLMNLNLGTVVIWIGPVPVVFLFNFDIYAGVDASVTISAHTVLSNEVSLASENQVGAEYSNGQWQAINDWTLIGNADFDVNPTASISATLSDYLRGALSVKIYGVLGPSLYLKPYQYNILSYPPFDYELGVGLAAGLDFKVQILSWVIVEFNHTFIDYTQNLNILSPPPDVSYVVVDIFEGAVLRLIWNEVDPPPDVYIIYADNIPIDTLISYAGSHYYDADLPAKKYGITSCIPGIDYESDPTEIDIVPVTTSGISVYGNTDPDTTHHSGYGFNTSGVVVTYSLSDTSNWPLIDQWIYSDYGFPMFFFTPNQHIPPLNGKANYTSNSGTISFDNLNIAAPPGYYTSQLEVGSDTVYSLFMDLNDNGWDNSIDHFAKIKVVSINGLHIQLKIAYQPIPGLRWLVTP